MSRCPRKITLKTPYEKFTSAENPHDGWPSSRRKIYFGNPSTENLGEFILKNLQKFFKIQVVKSCRSLKKLILKIHDCRYRITVLKRTLTINDCKIEKLFIILLTLVCSADPGIIF